MTKAGGTETYFGKVNDQQIKIWETATGKELRTIKAHLGNVLCVRLSNDNQWLASGSIDGVLKISKPRMSAAIPGACLGNVTSFPP